MKIAIILPHFYPYVGGGEKMFYDLAKGAAAAGHEVRVVARDVGKEYRGVKRLDGFSVHYCRWKSLFGHPLPLTKDIEPVIEWCDIVHSSIFTTAPVVSRLAKKYGKPSVLTVYEVRGSKWFWTDVFYKAVIYWLVEQYTCRQRFDIYHAISEATKNDYLRYIGKRDVRRIYLANEMRPKEKQQSFSLREYFGIGTERTFLYYGRPGKTKGVDVYLKAIRILAGSGTDLSRVKFCFLLGKEPEDLRKSFEKKVHTSGLDGIIRIRDSVSRDALSDCIAQADCVVVPSVTEGFGFSALEACQMGTPLIYSDGGSLPEVAYGCCRSFHNRNAADLADQIYRFMANGKKSFERIPEKSFTYDEMLGGILALYGELTKSC